MFLSIIIPAYNEEKRISKTILDIDRYLSHQDYDYEILVVSDGSKDNTVRVAENLSRMVKNLRVIENKENNGKGFVVKQGMLEAKGKYRVFTDADNSTSMEHIEKFLPYFSGSSENRSLAGEGKKESFDVVIGSRAIKGANIAVHQPFIKELAGRLGNIFIQIMAVPGIRDTQCGFKTFSEKAAKDVFSRLKIFRWGFDVEALAIARKFGYKIKEVPVTWINDPFSHVSFSAYFQVLLETLRVRINLWTGKYDNNIKYQKSNIKNTY